MHYPDNLNPMTMLLYMIRVRQSHGMLHVFELSFFVFLVVIKTIFPLKQTWMYHWKNAKHKACNLQYKI